MTPDSFELVSRRDGLVYLRLTTRDSRLVLDAMFESGVRRTYDFFPRSESSREVLVKAFAPDRQHESHHSSGAVAEFALALLGSPADFDLCGLTFRPGMGIVRTDSLAGLWDRSVLSALVRSSPAVTYEEAEDMLRLHYGLGDGLRVR